MPFPTSVDAIVDAPPVTAATRISASQVLGPQRVTVGPTWVNFKSDLVGGVGDGVTDDTAAFAKINQQTAGSRIYFPPGTYTLTAGALANITNPYVFQGAGRDATFINSRTGSGGLFNVSGVSSFGIEDITFDGTNIGGTIFGPLGFTNSTFVRVRNCRLRNNTGGAGSNALTLANVQHAWIEDNEFNNIGGSGFYLNDPGANNFNDHIWVLNNRFTNCGLNNLTGGNAAFDTNLSRVSVHRFLHIEGNNFTGQPTGGIGLGADFSFCARNRVDNTFGTNTLGECIAIQGQHNKVMYNWLSQRASTAAACVLLWLNSTTQPEDHNEISHNFCTGVTTGPGIAVYFAVNGITNRDTYIHDNIVTNCASGIIAGPVSPATTGTWTNAVIINNKLTTSVGTPVDWNVAIGAPTFHSGNYPGLYQQSKQTPAFAATFTPDLRFGGYISVILTANITINTPVNPATGTIMTFVWRQDATGGRTITYGAGYAPSASWPAVNTAANAPTIDRFIYDGGGTWVGVSRSTG